MPLKLAANLSWLYQDIGFMERFAAAAGHGFKAVEFLFPYDFAAADNEEASTSEYFAYMGFQPAPWQKPIFIEPAPESGVERDIALCEGRELAMGKNRFIVAFRSSATSQPVDAGTVTVGSSMAMPGMAPMTAPIELEPAGATGLYVAKGEFAMSGAWKFEVRWEGPAGKGSAIFNTNVR